MAEYLSIADFAKQAGVTTQAVYARLDNQDVKKFVKIVKGKKALSSEALELFAVKREMQVCNQDDAETCKVDKEACQVGNQVDNNTENTDEIKEKQEELLHDLVKTLQKQLEEKDKQISEKDKQITDLNSRLADITQALLNEQKALQQANTLHAGTMRASLVENTEADQKEATKKRWWKFWE